MVASVIELSEVAEPARLAMGRLREELPAIFGDSLLAIWLYGGQLQAGGSPGDVDGHVVLIREPSSAELARVRSLHQAIRSEFGIHEFDVWYVVQSEVASAIAPRDVNWHEEYQDGSWALKRAHWFAGAYVKVFGVPPTDVVLQPDWSEVEAELLAQVEEAGRDIERTPLLAGLSLRLCRVVRTLATRDVVQSKLGAADGLLPKLSAASRAHVAAAVRAYQGVARGGDEELMRANALGFFEEIRALVDAVTSATGDGASGHARPSALELGDGADRAAVAGDGKTGGE